MKIKKLLIATLISAFCLNGCGKDAELEKYNENMTVFTKVNLIKNIYNKIIIQ